MCVHDVLPDQHDLFRLYGKQAQRASYIQIKNDRLGRRVAHYVWDAIRPSGDSTDLCGVTPSAASFSR
jgi:hypothetical protein